MALQTENRENTLERWQAALAELKEEPPINPPARSYSLNVVVAIDTSGSMDGARLNAVKIGLCCLLSSLKETDRVILLHFDSHIRKLTETPMSTAQLLPALPGLLTGMRADGMTKYYDAVLECLQVAAQAFPQDGDVVGPVVAAAPAPAAVPAAQTVSGEGAPMDVAAMEVEVAAPAPAAMEVTGDAADPAPAAPAARLPSRTVVVTLTDGEDTASDADIEDVRLHLRSPGVNQLMFLAVTVDMSASVLRTLEPWFIYSHSKRIDVTVRTGRRLVGVFAETVLLRMLRDTEEAALSFYATTRGAILRDGCVEPPPATRRGRHYSEDGAAAVPIHGPLDPHAGALPHPHGGVMGAIRSFLHFGAPTATNPGQVLDPTSLGVVGGNDDDENEESRHPARCYSPIFTRFDSADEAD